MSQTDNITVSSLFRAFTTSLKQPRITTTTEPQETTEFEGSDVTLTIAYCVIVGVIFLTMCCCMVLITRVYTTRQNPQIVFRTGSKFSVRMSKSSSRNQICEVVMLVPDSHDVSTIREETAAPSVILPRSRNVSGTEPYIDDQKVLLGINTDRGTDVLLQKLHHLSDQNIIELGRAIHTMSRTTVGELSHRRMKNSSGSENLRRVRLSPAAGTSTDTGDKMGWASGTSSLPSGSITVTVTKDSEGSQPTTAVTEGTVQRRVGRLRRSTTYTWSGIPEVITEIQPKSAPGRRTKQRMKTVPADAQNKE